ncbi:hypothetical protein [Sutcliffiella horikoshii]|uniref:hypothetical protein n=1 Tax=Sutcliffiella horikoshii TaxID=79883 RepID=UPI001F1C34F1|nr:hypothetical protein [Sutcliffiella horikoshii]
MMEGKPNHYDGSVQTDGKENETGVGAGSFVVTDDMRKNIGGNPFVLHNEE